MPSPSPHEPEQRAAAVLVAAGNSTRMELAAGQRKPFLRVAGRTVLEHTAAAFNACPEVHEIVIVAQAGDVQRIRELAHSNPVFSKLGAVVPGGAERTDSVREGVRATGARNAIVAIHDAARLLIRSETISRAIRCAQEHGAALVAVPVQDTIKRSVDGEHSAETLERSELWAAQTPQVFQRVQILELLERPSDAPPTDDAALYERYVGPLPIVRGESTNLKMTTPTDLEIARALLKLRSEGHDPA